MLFMLQGTRKKKQLCAEGGEAMKCRYEAVIYPRGIVLTVRVDDK